MSANISPAVSPDNNASGKGYVAFLIFIAILGAFSSLVNDMYLPTIPSMVREFHTTPSITQLGLSMAMLGMGIGAMLWGSLSDRYGRKPMLLWSLGIFGVSTIVAVFSQSIWFFVGCRLAQGLGAGGAMVVSYSIPADIYSGRRLARVMAIVGAINGVAPAAAPLVGGAMTDSVGWRGIFVLLLAIGVVMLVWSWRRPESLPPSRRLSSGSVSAYAKAYFSLLRDRRFMTFVWLKAIGIGLLYAYISSAPFIFQDHYGFSSFEFGMIFGANAIAIAIGSTLVMRFKVLKRGLVTGTVVMSVFAVCEAVVMYRGMSFAIYELMAVPMLLGSGMVFASANGLGMDEGRADAGTAGAILNVVKYIFAAVVAPLVAIGDILHSSAWCFGAIAVTALLLVIPAIRMRPIASMIKS